MSLMLKLLAITLLINNFLYADSASDKVEDYLNGLYSQNSRLKSFEVNIADVVEVEGFKGWNAYIVDIQAILKDSPTNTIKQRRILFSDGALVTAELISLSSGENLAEMVKPDFKPEYYSKANLIYGNENAEHKVAIFSDPLCPFCRGFVPGAIEDMKKEPKKFAIYYYHYPLDRIHPASVPLVKAAVAAELKGFKDVVLKLYTVKIDANEKDIHKLLAEFNRVVGSNIVPEDLNKPEVQKQIGNDLSIANNAMVAGTPTLYLDDKIDKTKKKYLKIK